MDDLQEVLGELWIVPGLRLSLRSGAAASCHLQPQMLHIRQEIPVAE